MGQSDGKRVNLVEKASLGRDIVLSPDGRKKSHIKSRGKVKSRIWTLGKLPRRCHQRGLWDGGEGQSAVFPQAQPHHARQQTLAWLQSGHCV